MISHDTAMQTALILRTHRFSLPLRMRPLIDKVAYDLADLYASQSLRSFDRDRFLITVGAPRTPQ